MSTCLSTACSRKRVTRRVADVFREGWQRYQVSHTVPTFQRKAASHIMNCRTASLGGHLWRCDVCGHDLPLYNSCRDRHCPTCQTIRKEDWLSDRKAELLPVGYFHVVFTLPHELNPLIMHNRKLLLGEFFSVINEILQNFAADPRWRLEGQLGFMAVLHTWNQLLMDHFHLHCVVPGGVWQKDQNRFVPARQKFLFRKDSMSKALRTAFLRRLNRLHKNGKLHCPDDLADPLRWAAFIKQLSCVKWIVYAKRPFAGPEQVLEYLGRYTHRVAISDNRILALGNPSDGSGQTANVTFSYRDRKDDNQLKAMTLATDEFIRRFLLHILPKGFQKIRFFGWLSHNRKTETLTRIRTALNAQAPEKPPEESLRARMLRLTGEDINRCPFCKKGALVKIGNIPAQHMDTS